MTEKNTPPVPQTYEEFHKCMEFLKKKNEQSDKFNEVIQELTYDGYAYIYDEFIVKYIELLARMWHCDYTGHEVDDISYFVYDAEFGAKADEYFISEELSDGTVVEYKFYNDKDLYEYLTMCWPQRCGV